MDKNAVFGTMLLIGMLALAFNVQPAKAEGIITGEAASTNRLHAYLRDSQNYLYQSVGVLSPKAFRLVDLPPGETIRGEIYWEVPSEATIDAFVWHDHRSYIVIPEFPSSLIIPLFMTATLLAVIVYRRKPKS